MIARRKNYDLRQKVYIKIVIMNNNSNIQKYEKTEQPRNYPEKIKQGNLKHLAIPYQKSIKLKFSTTATVDSPIIYYLYYHFHWFILEKEVEEKKIIVSLRKCKQRTALEVLLSNREV